MAVIEITWPSIWDLLLPNATLTTLFGIVLLVLGYFVSKVSKKVGSILMGIGFLMAWGWSIIQDIWNTQQGQILIIGLIAFLGVLAIIFTGRERNIAK